MALCLNSDDDIADCDRLRDFEIVEINSHFL